MPACTASSTASGGASSPAAEGLIWNRLSVSAATRAHRCSTPPFSVASVLGKLEASRHCTSGGLCARAGAGSATAAPNPALPSAAEETKRRRFIRYMVRPWQCLNFLPLPQGQGALRGLLRQVEGSFRSTDSLRLSWGGSRAAEASAGS